MSRKTRKYATGLNLVPLTDVSSNGYESPRVLAARLRREDAKRQDAERRAIEDADPTNIAKKALVDTETKVALQKRDRLKKLYRDAETISDYIKHDIEVLTDDIGLPTTDQPVSMTDAGGRVKQFVDGLPAGTFQSDEARNKFRSYAYVAAYNRTVIDNSTLRTMLERCESLGIGVTLPRTDKQATVTPNASVTPTMDDLLSLDCDTRDGLREAKKIADDLSQIEAMGLWQAWAQSLADNFSLIPTKEDRERIKEWFRRNNRSWNDRSGRAFNDCRKFMVKQGYWPESALTKEEIAARDWGARSERSDTFESKRELRRQLDHFGEKVLG